MSTPAPGAEKPSELNFETLKAAVAGTAAAFRCRRTLQPAGGEGDKVFPPTFANAVYAMETRHVQGEKEPLHCVLLDSVQSQANRMESALQDAVDGGTLAMPLVVVDFSGVDPTGDVAADEAAGKLLERVGRITSLQAPHRLADALLRDSEVGPDGARVAFRKSPLSQGFNDATPANATAIFALSPTALIFGMWDSTGPKGGLGAKFERAMVSEIVGIGVERDERQRNRGVRRDPIEARSEAQVIKNPDKSWRMAEPGEKGAVNPSKINHSSIPFPKAKEGGENSGVTVARAEQTTTVSLIALRRLGFPVTGARTPERDAAARTVLAALGLAAAALAMEAGSGLRSRCLLWPDAPMSWELLDRPGVEPAKYSLSAEQALALVKSAASDAKKLGLPWPTGPLVLRPSVNLVKLIRASQILATTEDASE
ncbi:MAG: type I-G CRISPR-associated RAMP protein Csb1/Cas7g [Terriglobales bacterium]